MDQGPRKISIWRKPRYIPLQYRFIVFSTILLVVLLGTIIWVVTRQQSQIIKNQVELRGLAVTQSLAAASKADLLTYNYIALTQSANQAIQDPDLAYVIIHDKEGRVAAYSGRPDLQGKFLQDSVTLAAVGAPHPLVQATFLTERQTPILDIAVPVSVPGSERIWGTIRAGVSLTSMYSQIRRVQWTIALIGLAALVPALLACIWLARRITNPLAQLVNATIVAAEGNLDQEVQIATGDEVEVLADNFSVMIGEILAQRRHVERQLLEITQLQRYLNKLLTTMSDGLLSVDMDGTVSTMNPAAQMMLGVATDQTATDQSISTMLGHLQELHVYLRNALESPYSARQRELHLAMGTEAKTFIVAPSVLPDSVGNPSQLIINLHDITDLKKLEARMRQTERLAGLGTLAAGMAHEIRNPLSAIKTFVQLLPRKLDKPSFLEKFNRTVPREVERINRLIEDLLELARAPRYEFEIVDIEFLVRQALDLFETQLHENNIHCRIDLPDDLPLVWVDPDQLAKAFNNLILNAIQATTDGGQLTIRAAFLFPGQSGPAVNAKGFDEEANQPWLSLIFQDTGAGISSEDLKNIFNPFFTTKDSGTGLGLAITHKVITEHGGEIEVASTLGLGSRFTIRLPALENRKADVYQRSATA
jgi:PAS domain S-box-containing protein